MDKNLDNIFSKYISGELSPEERGDFQKKLAEDADFKLEFDHYRMGHIAGERVHYHELKAKVSKVIDEENAKAKKGAVVRKMYFKISAYAAILILAPLLTYFFLFRPNTNPASLYAEYYQPPPYSASRLSGNEENMLEKAKYNYSAKNWEEAIKYINELDDEQSKEAIAQRILAHSLMNIDREKEAIATFKELGSNTSSEFTPDDLWYIGLAHLKALELDSSLVYFSKITSGDPDYKNFEQAKTLITNIRKMK